MGVSLSPYLTAVNSQRSLGGVPSDGGTTLSVVNGANSSAIQPEFSRNDNLSDLQSVFGAPRLSALASSSSAFSDIP